jgi:ornithine cyclodeaminase
MPLLLTERDVARCLTMDLLVPLMRRALEAFSLGRARQPVRTSIRVESADGFYGVMPALIPSLDGRAGALGLKSVSFYPGNQARGIPTHLATILLLDPDTGALEAAMDGRLITEMRTAAVSAVSVQLLAREGPTALAILGSGVQARSHLEALSLVRPLTHVQVWSRRAENARRFAQDMAVRISCPIVPAETVAQALEGADLVATVSSATEPIVLGDWLRPGMHLCVVGSSSPRMRELDTAAVKKSRVFVDSRQAAMVEAGDLLIPIQEGAITPDHVVAELGEVALGRPGRQSDREITLFKSLGLGVEDLASARLCLARAQALGIGTEIPL